MAGSRNRLEGMEMGKDRGAYSCNDSLGMLSTVALYHSELSDGGEEEEREANGGRKEEGSVGSSSVDDGMAHIKLESSAGMYIYTVGEFGERGLSDFNG